MHCTRGLKDFKGNVLIIGGQMSKILGSNSQKIIIFVYVLDIKIFSNSFTNWFF